jgi:hypothetical protein
MVRGSLNMWVNDRGGYMPAIFGKHTKQHLPSMSKLSRILLRLPAVNWYSICTQVVAVESSIDAVRNARRSCSDLANLDLVTATVEAFIVSSDETFDVVILDPPRAGAGHTLIPQIANKAESKIIYIACEPAALARDTAALNECGWQLTKLRAFDAFPMTAHFECIALFEPARTA